MPHAKWQMQGVAGVSLHEHAGPALHHRPASGARRQRVVVVSACSGHGFKFATAIGEIVADLVAERKPRFDLDMFRMTRFAAMTPLQIKGVRVV